MTLKDMMKKVETYNEIADLMGTQKAALAFADTYRTERFLCYSDLWKYIRRKYLKEVADLILKDDTWGIDEDTTLIWKDAFSKEHTFKINTTLVAD